MRIETNGKFNQQATKQQRSHSGCGPTSRCAAVAQQPRTMSALPPIATELVRRNEVTLCAISRQSALQHFVTPDANRAHCSFKRF
jgi:hypothetical protein